MSYCSFCETDFVSGRACRTESQKNNCREYRLYREALEEFKRQSELDGGDFMDHIYNR